jgi:hypothetical protein
MECMFKLTLRNSFFMNLFEQMNIVLLKVIFIVIATRSARYTYSACIPGQFCAVTLEAWRNLTNDQLFTTALHLVDK